MNNVANKRSVNLSEKRLRIMASYILTSLNK